jgi:hypothetical protein
MLSMGLSFHWTFQTWIHWDSRVQLRRQERKRAHQEISRHRDGWSRRVNIIILLLNPFDRSRYFSPFGSFSKDVLLPPLVGCNTNQPSRHCRSKTTGAPPCHHPDAEALPCAPHDHSVHPLPKQETNVKEEWISL